MRKPRGWSSRLLIAGFAAVGLAAVWSITSMTVRVPSVVVVRNNGMAESSFCTTNGQVFVVHSGWNDANGSYAIGHTLLVGPATYRLGPGNASLAQGCYAHKMANTSVVGNAWAKSTVWYDK
jgi:hypothetical protein